MINNQLADSISRSGAFGLAKSLQGNWPIRCCPMPPRWPPVLTPLAAPWQDIKQNP